MFTGIVQTRATLLAKDPQPSGMRLVVDTASWPGKEARPIELGESICVSGVCLTVTDCQGDKLSFDVVIETLNKTTLGSLELGDPVNLERAVTPSQPLGGHFMQGHVDGIGKIIRIDRAAQEYRLALEPEPALMDYMIPKGSVAIDGVSLTIAALDQQSIEVALIPTTLELTTLGQRKQGDTVNLEADILAKTVVHHLQRQSPTSALAGKSPVTWQTLRDAGF